jgi:hypothetical protein
MDDGIGDEACERLRQPGGYEYVPHGYALFGVSDDQRARTARFTSLARETRDQRRHDRRRHEGLHV